MFNIFDNVVYDGTEDNIGDRERAYFVRGYVNRPNDSLSLLFQCAEHWAFVWHDKDNKVPHCHFIVRFKNNKTPSAMARWLRKIDNKQNWHFSALRDKYAAFDYLYHRDEKSIAEGKIRYNDVLTDDIAYFTRGGQSDRDNQAFYNDLVINKLSRADMAKKYGRDYLKNITKYEDARNLIIAENEIATNEQDSQLSGLYKLPSEYWSFQFAENFCRALIKTLKVQGIKFDNVDAACIDAAISNLCSDYFD